MKRAFLIPLALVASGLAPLVAGDFPQDPLGWPAARAEHKPWTRWWWLGSAVDKPELTRQLEAFAAKGLGGVEICPIYGAVGAEKRYLDFLSPEWMEMLAHVTTEAKRLGLGVDMTTGTGWPFGGPQVTPEMASHDLTVIRRTATGGQPVSFKLPAGTLQCLRAFPTSGPAVDLMEQADGAQLTWDAPEGTWEIIGLAARSPIQQVKRSAPGGAGNVLDPFSPAAMESYLERFDKAFASFQAPPPRAQFHDSFEYYEAQWTPDFFAKFQQARGYDLRDRLPEFVGKGDAADVARVRADYRETLSELHLAYLKKWHGWAVARGEITRNQAHGSPGNLLDHYAVSEIPETEIFRHVDERQVPMMKIAASAAHTRGGNLVSAETFTWLDEHFQVTPEKLKQAADFVFLTGVNHLFFHGIPYSPEDAGWPGWQFYASTHMGPAGGLWRDLSAFTGYLQRCQSILQDGEPTADVLMYFPMHDLWHDNQAKLPLFTIHNQEKWLWPTPFYQTSLELWKAGIDQDYVSDAVLAGAAVKDGGIRLGGRTYAALVLAGVERMPHGTMEHIRKLAEAGGKVIVRGGLPDEVPGFAGHEARRGKLRAAAAAVPVSAKPVQEQLESCGVRRESMVDSGLRYVRRSWSGGHQYFVVNPTGQPFDGVVPLATPFRSAVWLDPWHLNRPHAAEAAAGGLRLRLAAGASIVLRTFRDQAVEAPPAPLPRNETAATPVSGPWQVTFVEGGPTLPEPATLWTAAFWTTLPGEAVRNFSGTARYTTAFDFTGDPATPAVLDLGRVAHTARVRLNGKDLGISWTAPHELPLRGALQQGRNVLEIEVTNLAANRIADLDRRGVEWKKFHEINFVNIDYKPFDAAGWPVMDSGLAGPVRLIP